MAENVHTRRHGTNAKSPSLLCGLLYDEDGNRFTPFHAVKRGKRYLCYVSQGVVKDAASVSALPGRIPAGEIEKLIPIKLESFFSSADQIVSALAQEGDDLGATRTLIRAAAGYAKLLEGNSPSSLSETLAAILTRILVHADSIDIQINRTKFRAHLLGSDGTKPQVTGAMLDSSQQPLTLTIETRLKRCGGERG